LSSHLLFEVESVADRFVMIAGGRLVANGAKAELVQGRSGALVRAADDSSGLRAALAVAGLAIREARPDHTFVVDAAPPVVGRAAATAGVALAVLQDTGEVGLEELFLSLTGTPASGSATGSAGSAAVGSAGRPGRS
jgi:ABC-2 type transport system ATP-binding protein